MATSTSGGTARKFDGARARLRAIAESVSDEATMAYLLAAFDALVGTGERAEARRWFVGNVPEALEHRIGRDFLVSDVTTQWLRSVWEEIDDRVPAVARSNKSTLAIPFIDVESLGVDLPDTPLLSWAKRNGKEIAKSSEQRSCPWAGKLLEHDGTPRFELMEMRHRLKGRKEASDGITCVQFDTESMFVRNLIMDAIRSSRPEFDDGPERYILQTSKVFTTAMGFVPDGFGDFTVETFSTQFDYLWKLNMDAERNRHLSGLVLIYLHMIGVSREVREKFTFTTGLPPSMLARSDFTHVWRLGYRAYAHVPTDPVPSNPLWILYPGAEELSRTSNPPHGVQVDVSHKEERLQEMLASWLWKHGSGAYSIRKMQHKMRRLLDFLEPSQRPGMWRATNVGINEWLMAVTANSKPKRRAEYQKKAEMLLEYGRENGYIEIAPRVGMLLRARAPRDGVESEKRLVSDEHVGKLRAELERRSDESLLDMLAYQAFMTIGTSSVRISNVCSMRPGDLVDDPVPGLYFIRSHSKTTGSGKDDKPITARRYRELTELIALTDEVRGRAAPEVAQYLFIYEVNKRQGIRRLTGGTFGRLMKRACEDIGIPKVDAADIRKYFHTKTQARIQELDVTDLVRGILSGHARFETTKRYYIVEDDIRGYLEAAEKVVLSDDPLWGEVMPDDELPVAGIEAADSDMVGDGKGYCRNAECDVAGMLACLACPGFVTTPRCRPEMEEAVEIINAHLRDRTTSAQMRERLNVEKAMLLAYIAEMTTVERRGR